MTMPIAQIVFMFAYTPTPWDAERYGFATLRKAGIAVEILDLSALIATRHYPVGTIFYADEKLHTIKNYQELNRYIQAQAKNSYFVDTINGLNGLQWAGRRIYRLLKLHAAAYIIIEIGGLPLTQAQPLTLQQRLRKFSQLKKIPAFLKRKIGRPIINWQQKKFKLYQLPRYIFASQHELLPTYLARYALSANIIKPIHSFDHDRYYHFIQQNPEALEVKSQCTFIDQALTEHCDFGGKANPRPVTIENYFNSLNNFFTLLEKKLALSVNIAASPRASYTVSPFGKRPVLKQATLASSVQSQLVITHSSTAVSYAVLAARPILLITTNEMQKAVGFYQFIFKMAEALQVSVLNIDDAEAVAAFDFTAYLSRDFAYDHYKYHYVMTKGLPATTIWEQVASIFA